MRKPILATMTAMLVLAWATVAMAADPHVGTWKMNVAKSKANPGPPLKSDTVTFTAQDNGIKLVEDIVEAGGKVYHLSSAAKYDGKDYPVTGDPDSDTIAFRIIDANTFDVVVNKAGKEVFKSREIFSKDGKTMTRTTKGTNDKGKEFTDTDVFDKQ